MQQKLYSEKNNLTWEDFVKNINKYLNEIMNSDYFAVYKKNVPEILKISDKSAVILLKSGKKTVLLKIKRSRGSLLREVFALKVWRKSGIKTPKIFKLLESNKYFPFPIAVMEYIPQSTVEKKYRLKDLFEQNLIKQMGETLSKMHSVKGEGYGVFSVRPKLSGEFETFSSYIHNYIDKMLDTLIKSRILNEEDRTLVDTAIKVLEKDLSGNQKPVLSHYDFGTPNLLDTSPLTVIDPDPVLTHPFMDLAWSAVLNTSASSDKRKNYTSEFISGYKIQFKEEYSEYTFAAAVIVKAIDTLNYYYKKGKDTQWIKNVIKDYAALLVENKQNMILIEDFKKLDQSIHWKLQDNYYKSLGPNAWLHDGIPYKATCNSLIAEQVAEIVYASVENIDKAGRLSASDNIRVLETASGVGLFAINFLKAFQKIDKVKGGKYYRRFKYIFTDLAESNLMKASKNPTLLKLHKKGVLIFGVQNAMKPQYVRYLGQKDETPTPSLAAVIGNYVHCCLPVKIMLKKNSEYYEKYLKIYYKDQQINKSHVKASEIINRTEGVNAEHLFEQDKWVKISDDFFEKLIHKKLMLEGIKNLDMATVYYPYGSLRNIEGIMPKLIKGGIIIINDNAYVSFKEMVGEQAELKGNTITSYAHRMNYPLIDMLMKKSGFSSQYTVDPYLLIKTILIEKGSASKLSKLFEKLFVKKNNNSDAFDYYHAGTWYMSRKEYRVAIRYYKRAEKYLKNDAYNYYNLGYSLRKLGYYDDAINAFKKGKQYDYYSKYDFEEQLKLCVDNNTE